VNASRAEADSEAGGEVGAVELFFGEADPRVRTSVGTSVGR